MLTTQSFIIRFSPHTGGNTWHLQKQTNKHVSPPPPPPREHLRILSPSLQGMYSGWPATFNRHSLVIRRINFWPLVLTWMMRTCLSWSGNTSSTQPRRHWPHGAFWSTTSTTSLTFRFFLASLHFFCMLSVDRYSSLQHFQNTLTRVAGEGITILETMTNNNRVGSNLDFFCKPYCTFWSEPTWPELAQPPFSLRKLFKTVPLTSTSTVCNSSKHKVDQSSTFFRGVLIPLTSHSKNPPHHGALSVIKFMKFFG